MLSPNEYCLAVRNAKGERVLVVHTVYTQDLIGAALSAARTQGANDPVAMLRVGKDTWVPSEIK
jgi:hypothetical protein